MDRSRLPDVLDSGAAKEAKDFWRRTAMEMDEDGEWKTLRSRCEWYWVPYTSTAVTWTDRNSGLQLTPNQSLDYAEDGSCGWEAGGSDDSWHGASCALPSCFQCEKETQPILRLRGICPESKLTNIFTPDNKGLDLWYVGLSNTNIEYNTSSFLWVAREVDYLTTWATNAGSQESGALGTSEWTVYGDSRKCTTEASYKVTLTLSGCNKAEFSCVDGSCISMERRCDGRVDCTDSSDEVGCSTAIILSSYNKAMTPPPKPGQEKAVVTISLKLMDILKLDEIGKLMFVKYVLRARWIDPGLTFHNLKRNPNQNVLSQDESSRIWVPKIIMMNTETEEESILDKKSIIRILANDNFTHSRTELSHHQNIYIFPGEDTSVEMARTYATDFLCLYNMNWYPFDTQSCSLDFMLDATANTFVSLMPGSLNYSGPVELTQYFVRQSTMTAHTFDDREGVRVLVVLGRRLLSNILTVYMPTILLNIMGHVTVYFKPFFFEAIITVNLTVMLVLTTM